MKPENFKFIVNSIVADVMYIDNGIIKCKSTIYCKSCELYMAEYPMNCIYKRAEIFQYLKENHLRPELFL